MFRASNKSHFVSRVAGIFCGGCASSGWGWLWGKRTVMLLTVYFYYFFFFLKIIHLCICYTQDKFFCKVYEILHHHQEHNNRLVHNLKSYNDQRNVRILWHICQIKKIVSDLTKIKKYHTEQIKCSALSHRVLLSFR